jgi:DUF4097 and DUF4098 domain-containing protein YvlB
MEKKTVETSMVPEITIEQVHGNLEIKGWDHPKVEVNADLEDLNLEEQDDTVLVTCQGNCAIRLPHSASIQIEQVHGNMYAKLLDDQLSIDRVHGNLNLRSVGVVQVDTVEGEFSAKGLSGDLQVSLVRGNASVREAHGNCNLEEVHGNLDLRNIEYDLRASAHGNARLRLAVMLGMDYEINATGNVQCRIPEDASVELGLASESQIIKLKLPDEKRTCREANCNLVLGDGGTRMNVSAGGAIHLSTQSAEWVDPDRDQDSYGEFSGFADDFSQQIAQQVETQIQAQMEAMTQQMNEQMSQLSEKISQSGLSPEQIERIMGQARKANEREAARAQEKMRRAQDKLERKLEAARRREEMKARTADRRSRSKGSWGFEFNAPPAPPVQETVSDEERLMILRMLEQKKISMEEAEQLLEALEGRV